MKMLIETIPQSKCVIYYNIRKKSDIWPYTKLMPDIRSIPNEDAAPAVVGEVVRVGIWQHHGSSTHPTHFNYQGRTQVFHRGGGADPPS